MLINIGFICYILQYSFRILGYGFGYLWRYSSSGFSYFLQNGIISLNPLKTIASVWSPENKKNLNIRLEHHFKTHLSMLSIFKQMLYIFCSYFCSICFANLIHLKVYSGSQHAKSAKSRPKTGFSNLKIEWLTSRFELPLQITYAPIIDEVG